MNVLYVVVPLALLVVLAAVIAYLWAVRHGQFDDLATPAVRVLHDDASEAPDRAGAPGSSPGDARADGRPEPRGH